MSQTPEIKSSDKSVEVVPKIVATAKLLDKSLVFIALSCLVISVVFSMLGVLMRYFFGLSYAIVEEICRYSIIYGVFLYIGPLIISGDHLKMDLVQTMLKGKTKHFNNLFINIIVFVSFVGLFLTSAQWVRSLLEMELMTSAGTMLMFIPTLVIPIGMLIASIYSILQITFDIIKIRNAEKIEHVEKEEVV